MFNPFARIPEGPTRTAVQAVSVVIFMGGLAWASVPFYDWFCRVTGFGGATNVAEAGSDVILDQTITVRVRKRHGARYAVGFQACAARNGSPHR